MADSVVTLVDGKLATKQANLDATGVSFSGSIGDGSNPFVASGATIYETKAHIIFAGSDFAGMVNTIFLALSTKIATKVADFRVYDVTNSQVICEKLAYGSTVVTPVNMGTVSNVPSSQADWAIQIRKNDTGAEGRVSAIIGYNG